MVNLASLQAQPTGPSPPGAADFKALLGVCGRLPARPPPARLAAHRLDPGQGPASSHWNDWQNYSTWLRYSSKLDYSTRLLRSGWLRAPPPLDMPPLFGYTQCTQTAIFVCHCSDLVAPSLGSPRRQKAASTVDLAGPKQKKPTLFFVFLKVSASFWVLQTSNPVQLCGSIQDSCKMDYRPGWPSSCN